MTKEAEGLGRDLRTARLGRDLRTARKALGLSVEQIAHSLELAKTTVLALEAEDWQRLPAPVFVRGYIRSYAVLVGADADALLKRHEADDPRILSNKRIDLSTIGGSLGNFDRGSRLRRPALLGLVALMVTAATVWLFLIWLNGEFWADGSESVAQVTAAESAVPLPGNAPGAAPETPSVVAPPLDAVQPAEAPEPIEPPPSAADESAPSPSLPEGQAIEAGAVLPDFADGVAPPGPQPETPSGVRRLTPTGDAELRLAFSETCWVDIKDMEGRRLYADIGQPNQILRLVGEGPFDLRLGYAPGVVVEFNGDPIPLAPHTRDHVASLVLGR